MDSKRLGEIAWTIFIREKVCLLKPNVITSGLKPFADKCKMSENLIKKTIALALNEGYGLRINTPETNDYSMDARNKIVLAYITEEIMRDGVKFNPDGFEREIGRIAVNTGIKKDEIQAFYRTILEIAYSGAMK